MTTRNLGWLACALLGGIVLATPAAAGWEPERYHDEDILEFLTVDAEDGDHWSKVWLVVIDGDVYVRLGKRAASRMETSTRYPKTAVRVAEEEFPDVTAESVPAMAEAVMKAMKEKYWTDIFVRYVDHPLTMRLRPTPTPQ